LLRLAGGVGLALAVGAPIGFLMGYYKLVDGALSPIMYILAPTPKIAFLPLIMLFLGLGDQAKIFLVFLTIVFQVFVTMRDAVQKISEDVYAPLIAAKCSQLFIFFNVVLPASLPAAFTAVRLGLATGIAVLFVSENFGTRAGLGYFIMDSWMTIRYPAMFAGILAMGAMGFVLTALVDFTQKRVCAWEI
jgi:NitT/TauT family transport system permease protein